VGGRDPSAADTSRTKGPLIADTRITIVIRPYLLRWPLREESENSYQSAPNKTLSYVRAGP
jgi:hypothetical protein